MVNKRKINKWFKKSGIILFLIISFKYSNSQELFQAIKLTSSEQYEAAQVMFKNLIAKDPKNSDYYYYYGENYLKSFFADSASISFIEVGVPAEENFKKGISADSINPINYVGLGKVYLLEGKLSIAKSYFNKAISKLPKRPNRSSEIKPERCGYIYSRIAEAYIVSKLTDTSLFFPYLRKAELYAPNDPEVFLIYGDAYIKVNDGSNAITYFKKAQSLDPKSPLSDLKIGQLWKRTKVYNDAFTYFKEALTIDSTYAPAYRELAELYALARRYKEAISTYNKFLKLSSNNITAKVRYASFLFLAKEYQQSINKIFEIQKEDSSFYILNRLLAYSYYELSMVDKTVSLDKGLPYIQKFFKNAKPEKIIASDWIYYGKILAKNKNDSLAIEKFKIGYAMDTTNLDILSDMAMCYSKIKKYPEAINCYLKRLTVPKPNPNDFYSLGKLYYGVKEWQKSDSMLGIFLNYKPDYIPAYKWRALANVNLDSTAKEGRAKPIYEMLLQKALPDSAKNVQDIAEAYSYLGYYYFKQYIITKKHEDAEQSIKYCEKVLAINPNDEKAKEIVKSLKNK